MPLKTATNIIEKVTAIFQTNGFKGMVALSIIIVVYIGLKEGKPFVEAVATTYREEKAAERQSRFEEKSFTVEYLERQLTRMESQIGIMQEQILGLTRQVATLTEQRRVESAAFFASPLPIWMMEWNGTQARLDDFNPAFVKLILLPAGIDEEGARGKLWSELFPGEQGETYNRDDLRVLLNRTASVTTDQYTLNRDGTKQYWHITKWPIVLDGQLVGSRAVAAKTPKN